MTVFGDAFALIAWINARDAEHKKVTDYFASYTGQIVLTEWVLLEVADALSRPAFRPAAVALIRRLRLDRQFEIIGYDPEVYRAGFDLFASRPDKAWSLTDCISFAVMTVRGLTDALTADHHFEQAGFRAIFKTC